MKVPAPTLMFPRSGEGPPHGSCANRCRSTTDITCPDGPHRTAAGAGGMPRGLYLTLSTPSVPGLANKDTAMKRHEQPIQGHKLLPGHTKTDSQASLSPDSALQHIPRAPNPSCPGSLLLPGAWLPKAVPASARGLHPSIAVPHRWAHQQPLVTARAMTQSSEPLSGLLSHLGLTPGSQGTPLPLDTPPSEPHHQPHSLVERSLPGPATPPGAPCFVRLSWGVLCNPLHAKRSFMNILPQVPGSRHCNFSLHISEVPPLLRSVVSQSLSSRQALETSTTLAL